LVDKLRQFLKPEIDQGLVVVIGDESTPIVRIKGRGLFALGSDKLETRFLPILNRIGEALKVEAGGVFVIGYTDNQPIRTVRFPSNFELSSARAQAAKDVIGRALGDMGRIKAEGRADADPLATNATPEGREENRRIEVVLRRAG
jgi:type VI secretion system protein ImpK